MIPSEISQCKFGQVGDRGNKAKPKIKLKSEKYFLYDMEASWTNCFVCWFGWWVFCTLHALSSKREASHYLATLKVLYLE